jgi:hypothetical protein
MRGDYAAGDRTAKCEKFEGPGAGSLTLIYV